MVSQVDFAATFAKIINYPLSKKEAIDSYNLLSVLEGKKYSKPLRVATVQNTSAKSLLFGKEIGSLLMHLQARPRKRRQPT